MYEEIVVLRMLLTLWSGLFGQYTADASLVSGENAPLWQNWYLHRLFSEVHLSLVLLYIGLLSCWVVGADTCKQTSWYSVSFLLDTSVLLNSEGFVYFPASFVRSPCLKFTGHMHLSAFCSWFDYFCLYCTMFHRFICESLIWISDSRKFYKIFLIF